MTGLIVVGVDGSIEAGRALDYAARDAVRRGARLRVVHVSWMPESWSVVYEMRQTTGDAALSLARDTAQIAVDELFATHPTLAHQLDVEIVGVSGRPVTELVEQSWVADMLVLGHRGRGAVASTVLGSVGLSCLLHARCPVTIVRPTRPAEPAADVAVASEV